jgi:hypothetical protein
MYLVIGLARGSGASKVTMRGDTVVEVGLPALADAWSPIVTTRGNEGFR